MLRELRQQQHVYADVVRGKTADGGIGDPDEVLGAAVCSRAKLLEMRNFYTCKA